MQSFSYVALLRNRADWFESDLVGNTKDRFSHDEANFNSATLYKEVIVYK